MKKSILTLCILLAGLPLFCGDAVPLAFSDGVILDQGVIRLAGEPVTIFSDDFTGGTKKWAKVVSYRNTILMKSSKKGLKLTNAKLKESDNAWELISGNLPLKPEFREFRFTLRARRTGRNMPLQGHGKSFQNQLEWCGSDGKILRTDPIRFPNASGKSEEIILENTVPEDAAGVRIRLGCDTPNLGKKDTILLEKIRLEAYAGKGKIKKEGIAEGVPLFIEDAKYIEWQGMTPPGTELLFQLSTAPDEYGSPGVWTPFLGPDKDPKEWYVSEGKRFRWIGNERAKLYPEITEPCWVRWRVKLIPNPRTSASPSLEFVKIGDEVSEKWTEKSDKLAPVVRFVCRTPSENPKLSFAFVVTDNTAVDWNTVKVTADGKDVTKKLTRRGNVLNYMPETPWRRGIHTAEITLKDIYGQELNSSAFFCRSARREGKVAIRQDGGILIDGKPFFPIGVYAVAKRKFNEFSYDKAMADLKKIGVNMVHTYSDKRNENFAEFASAAEKHGMKMFIACGSGSNGIELKPVMETVLKERMNDSILAWYIGDDTSAYHSPEEMRKRGEAIHNADPTRPTAQADGVASRNPKSNYRDYVFATDIFMPEIYPVRENTKADADQCAAMVVQDMKRVYSDLQEAHAVRRSIWPIIQYFQGWKAWKRYPTAKELKAMSFAALVTGANGIVWYTYTPGDDVKNHGITASKETWKTFAAVSKEIAALSDVLAEKRPDIDSTLSIEDGAATNALKDPSIVYEIRKSPKRTVLIAVNTANAPVQALFTVPGYKKAIRIDGIKVPEAKKGFFSSIKGLFRSAETFAVSFGPLETAVYELK